MSDGGANGGRHFPPVDPVGASLDEAVRDYTDVLARLDAHGQLLEEAHGRLNALRGEVAAIRDELGRCTNAVTTHALAMDRVASTLSRVAKHLGVTP